MSEKKIESPFEKRTGSPKFLKKKKKKKKSGSLKNKKIKKN